MDDDTPPAAPPNFPAYRPPSGPLAGMAVPGLALTGMLAGTAQLLRTGGPLWLIIAVPASVLAALVLMRLAAGRSATLTGPEGITVRSPLATRTVAWPDIQALEIRANPSAAADTRGIHEYAEMFDRTGRRIPLPHLNSKAVPVLSAEVARLRALWEQHRGPDWTRLPAVDTRLARAERSTDRQRAALAGIGIAALTFTGGMVLVLVLALTGTLGEDAGDSVLPWTTAGLAVAAVAAGTLGGRALARRRPGAPAANPRAPERK